MRLTFPYYDKVLHFGLIAGVSAVALHLGAPDVSVIGAGFLAGVTKEKYDEAHPLTNTFDGWDAYWTAAGAYFAVLARYLLC